MLGATRTTGAPEDAYRGEGNATLMTDGATNRRGTAASSEGGTYTLVVELADAVVIRVGALGDVGFAAGWYAYTGSALGPGGFARVDRHRELAAGEREVRHWHVDYLLGQPMAAIRAVVRTPNADIECAVSRAIDGERVPSFGASDCDCDSHLAFQSTREALVRSVRRTHDELS
jgi:Uri superfamily endonuclease